MSPLGTTNSPSPNGVSLLQLSSLAVSSHSPSPYHTHGHQCFLQKHASQYIPSSCLKPFQLLPVILGMMSEFFIWPTRLVTTQPHLSPTPAPTNIRGSETYFEISALVTA